MNVVSDRTGQPIEAVVRIIVGQRPASARRYRGWIGRCPPRAGRASSRQRVSAGGRRVVGDPVPRPSLRSAAKVAGRVVAGVAVTALIASADLRCARPSPRTGDGVAPARWATPERSASSDRRTTSCVTRRAQALRQREWAAYVRSRQLAGSATGRRYLANSGEVVRAWLGEQAAMSEDLDEIDRILARELVADGRATLAHLAATPGCRCRQCSRGFAGSKRGGGDGVHGPGQPRGGREDAVGVRRDHPSRSLSTR